MIIEVPDVLEVILEPRFLQHVPRVSADGEDLALLDPVVGIEGEGYGAFGDGAFVDYGLAVVFAVGLFGGRDDVRIII